MQTHLILILIISLFNSNSLILGNTSIKPEHKKKIKELELTLPKNAIEYTQVLLNSTNYQDQLNACGTLANILSSDDHHIRFYFISLMEELGQEHGVEKAVAYAMINKGLILLEQGEIKRADSILVKAENFGKQIEYPLAVAESFSLRSYSAYVMANYKEGIILANKAIEISKTGVNNTIERETGIAGAMMQKANCHMELGNFDLAISNFTEALRIYEKYDVLHSQIAVLNNLANCYLKQGNNTEAKKFGYRCITLLKSQPDNNNWASISNVMGEAYKELNSLDSAIHYFNKSIEAYKEINMPDHLAQVYTNIGSAYLALNQPKECVKYCNMALEVAKNLESHFVLLPIYINMGKAYRILNDTEAGIHYLEKSLELAEESNSNTIKSQVYRELANSYYSKKNYLIAYNYFESFYDLDQKIFALKKEKEIQQIRIRYETDKTESELANEKALTVVQKAKLNQSRIGLLASVATAFLLFYLYIQIRNKNKALDRARDTESFLRKESEHRIKNHLQMVAAFFRLHSQDLEEESAKKLVKQGESRIQAVGLLHHKLQMQKFNTSKINIKEYVEDLTENLMLSLDPRSNVILKSKIDTIELDTDQAIKIGLIINELINNSMKHFSTDIARPTLALSLTKRKGIQLKIQDNGNGFPSDFNSRKEHSFGIQLVEMMASQLHGEFSFYNNPGACFELNFN